MKRCNPVRTFRVILFALLFLPWLSCVPGRQEVERNQRGWIERAVEQAREEEAPDRRLEVFDIDWQLREGQLILSGEVSEEASRVFLLNVLELSPFDFEIVDRIRELPEAELGERTRGVVQVSVANLRREAAHPAELVTQLLLGMEVRILRKKGSWIYIQGPDQYLGWTESASVASLAEPELTEWHSLPELMVTERWGVVREAPTNESRSLRDLTLGCTLRETGRVGSWIRVRLPDNREGFVPGGLVQPLDSWNESHPFTPETLERLSRQFLGAPYLWGGTSPRGFDCSGFTQTLFRLCGVAILRDASQQVRGGEPIELGEAIRNLRKGDLLFFGTAAEGKEVAHISHVGIYVGGHEFIHAASGGVQLSSLDPAAGNYDEANAKRLQSARRYTKWQE